jgi:glycosyltransferase involved in cell wall biosynthesis
MAQVTVGVPVYNGAEYLEAGLACIRDQSYRDIEVIIYDNCSDDGTADIAKRFCAEDPRFRYFRQPVHKSATDNFIEVASAAQTPFFMWRAADDTSDLNYIETLLGLLIEHPDRDLAVARIVSSLPDGHIMVEHRVPAAIGLGGAGDHFAQLFRAHCCWYYGLYRREVAVPLYREVITTYPFIFGVDNLMLFVLQFDGKVIGTNATTFYQYLRYPEPRLSSAERAKRDDIKIERGRSFAAFAHSHVNRRITNPAVRWFYHAVTAYFVHKRVYSFSKRIRRGIIHNFAVTNKNVPA